MDCHSCHGTGEMENTEQHIKDGNEETQSKWNQGRGLWPFTCLVCGGSGFLEEAN